MKRCTNVMQSMKSHWNGIWLLKQSIIINIYFNYIKRLLFYYLRYPHDIRMKYCGFGCQDSCGYPRIRIRMRSSDTPLVYYNSWSYCIKQVISRNFCTTALHINPHLQYLKIILSHTYFIHCSLKTDILNKHNHKI